MIKGLHHNAYRCRDSEETRKFYEDFLGLPLVNAFKIETTQTGRKTGAGVLHSFFQLDDGSCLAFFEAPDMPFESRSSTTSTCTSRSRSSPTARQDVRQGQGRRPRGARRQRPQVHPRDLLPRSNGYVIELTAKSWHGTRHGSQAEPCAEILNGWQATKARRKGLATRRRRKR